MTTPRYPLYVISKGRWESRLTVRALETMGVPHRVVIEAQELDRYAAVMDFDKLLVLPFSNLGQGSIPARNWVWDHAQSEGHAWHWIIDDNIRLFGRLNRNMKVPAADGAIFCAAEDWVDRYENVAQAGFQYWMFATRRWKHPPLIVNTRIYSCILMRTDIPFRWRGRYNEDTDLSLRILKAGWCTALFYAFLADKMPTMTMAGGNTEMLYKLNDGQDGRLLMAQSLQQQHPDIVTVDRRWNRWQYVVDYRGFTHLLKRRDGLAIPEGVDERGMTLVDGVATKGPKRLVANDLAVVRTSHDWGPWTTHQARKARFCLLHCTAVQYEDKKIVKLSPSERPARPGGSLEVTR